MPGSFFRRWLVFATLLVGCLLPASGQNRRNDSNTSGNCGAPNGSGPNSTNYYGSGNPCAFRYSVPEENLNRLLNEVSYCTMYSRTQVNCSQALRVDYGQILLRPNENAPLNRNGEPSPAGRGGVADLRGSPEQLWQRAVTLIDRNNYRDAIPLLTQAANMGHPKAQATLGIAYQDGNGVKVDARAAAHWFGLAAAQGHRASQYALGAMYEEGEGGLPRDKRKATELYLASAKQGFDKAELIVGVGYLVGDGLPNDRRQAMPWLQRAAAQGSDLARHLVVILGDRSAPAQFANMNALLAYLAKLREQEMARLAARNASMPQSDPTSMARFFALREANQWRTDHGYWGATPKN